MQSLTTIIALDAGTSDRQKPHYLTSLATPPDIADAYERGSEEDMHFVNNLSIFLTTYFKNHRKLLETNEHQHLLMNGHYYLVQIARVDEQEIFKICLEYFGILVRRLYC